jgi:hypothetical protein
MTVLPVYIATEDELSEVVLTRLLLFTDRGYSIGTAHRRGGYGYLKRTIEGWNRAAASRPIMILTDLDNAHCPSELISTWLQQPMHPNLVIRIAVREVESWLLADSGGLAAYLRINARFIPEHPDELPDPKSTLVSLAAKSRSNEIKSRLVPRRHSTAKQGPDYNSCLAEFVTNTWEIESAVEHSPSLRRAVARYARFTPNWA